MGLRWSHKSQAMQKNARGSSLSRGLKMEKNSAIKLGVLDRCPLPSLKRFQQTLILVFPKLHFFRIFVHCTYTFTFHMGNLVVVKTSHIGFTVEDRLCEWLKTFFSLNLPIFQWNANWFISYKYNVQSLIHTRICCS